MQTYFSKLSKSELKKIATKKDYEELKKHAQKAINNGWKINLHFFQYRFGKLFPAKFKNKIYDTDKFFEMFGNKIDPEVFKYIKPEGTHCNITISQIFNMKAKEGHHIIPASKTTLVANTMFGTSFAPQDIVTKMILWIKFFNKSS